METKCLCVFISMHGKILTQRYSYIVKNLVQLKHLKMLLTNKNCIHEEIKMSELNECFLPFSL